MCIGAPMQVIESLGPVLVCEGRGGREAIDAMLIGEQSAGTWVLAHRGCAVRVLSAEEAQSIDAALAALDAVLAGESNVDAYFADLIAREDPALSPVQLPLAAEKS
jgi:hydrogenase expression/formation protein HypC